MDLGELDPNSTNLIKLETHPANLSELVPSFVDGGRGLAEIDHSECFPECFPSSVMCWFAQHIPMVQWSGIYHLKVWNMIF